MDAKKWFLLFVNLSLFMNGISSFTVINNVTVNSDILKEIFFEYIQKTEEIDFEVLQESEKYDYKKCFLSLREIVGSFPNKDVISFFDAWGHLPSGISSGNYYDIGDFDQCVKNSLPLNEINSDAATGQYCFVSLAVPENSGALNTGICVPETCSPEFVTKIFKKSSDELLNGALSDIVSVGHCTDGKIPPLNAMNIIVITIFSIMTALMILSSFYEFYMDYYQKTPVPVLLAFSVLTNGKKLFAINTKRSRNSIDCFNGIRVLSTLWIVCHHINSNLYFMQNTNFIKFNEFAKTFFYMPFAMATNAVNTFLFIGGLLVAFNGFRDLDKTKGKINVVMNVVHRYIRLTPIVAVGLLLAYGIYELLFTGPFRDRAISANSCDGSNWWPILLYIQNYYVTKKTCYDEAWYLAVDFQLYVLSPLLLVPMWKWGKKIAYFIVLLIVPSIAYIIVIFFIKGFTGYTQGTNLGEWELVYIPTHTRWTPWLIGFVLGYFMHLNRQTNFNVPKQVQLFGWIGSLTLLFLVVFGPYFAIRDGVESVFWAAMYAGFKHIAWTIALVWITFACYYGIGGIIDTFLSHPIWQPFTRLTYALYMMHMAVIRINFGTSRLPIYFSLYSILQYFFCALGITLFVAIYVTLAFESPILILEKFIFGGSKPVQKKVLVDSEQPAEKKPTAAVGTMPRIS
ncbi:nose resistant to fluoxetine protein 6-like [Eupeodes corollae]|uniref:nose resistant to fluoxetine protein 6-like n=1 Tax=Eupeodes corollae TaxID=290404 RepID=UPI002491DEDC|nr:nose resistant to fluoxetine protein 6-like [Eupeodes corollae]